MVIVMVVCVLSYCYDWLYMTEWWLVVHCIVLFVYMCMVNVVIMVGMCIVLLWWLL